MGEAELLLICLLGLPESSERSAGSAGFDAAGCATPQLLIVVIRFGAIARTDNLQKLMFEQTVSVHRACGSVQSSKAGSQAGKQ